MFTIFSLNAMENSQGFVAQLDDVPQLMSVEQWLITNLPVKEEHQSSLMQYASAISALKKELSPEDVIKELFLAQEKSYNDSVLQVINRHKRVARAFYGITVLAIVWTLFIGTKGLQCSWN